MIIFSPLQAQEPLQPVGFVVAIRGKAAAHDVQGNVRTLSMKSPVYEYDELKTGPRGRIQVLFSDNTIVSLGRKSTIEIAEYMWKPDEKTGAMKTKVKEGVFRVMGGAITKEAPRNFTTETPAATIGIRGSMYAGKVSGPQLMVVFEGGKGIDVSNDVGRISITKPGYGTHVMGADLPPLPPKAFSSDELSELNTQLRSSSEPDEEPDDAAGASNEEETSGETDDEDTGDAADDSSENEKEGRPADEDDGEQPGAASSETDEQAGDESSDVETGTQDDAATVSETADTGIQDSPAEYPEEEPPLQDDFTLYENTPVEAASPDNPFPAATAPVSQDIIDTSIAASQDDLEDTATQTSQNGINIEGAFLAQCTADMTTTDFTTWYGNSAQATAIDGSVAGSGTAQNATVFDFSFAMNPYDAGAVYAPPFDTSDNLTADSQTRYVSLPGVDRTFSAKVISSNLGEFGIFTISDALFTRDSTQYGYRDLGFVGIETPASQMPVDGINGYSGYALGVDMQLISGNTMHIETEISGVWMEVNWLSGKVIGRIDFDMDPSASPSGQYIGGKTFFFADISGNTLTNMRLCGNGGPNDETTPGSITWVEGTGEFARFYGSAYQGIGITGTGTFYDIETDQTTSIGTGRMITAGFREAQEAMDATSPTGTATFKGFVIGLSENMNDIHTNRRLFMNSDSSDFSFTVDRNSGTLSGTLSATDQISGTSSINSLEIGMSHGSAYVLDDNMAAILGDTGSDAIESGPYAGGLKPYGNYMITGDIDEQFSDYVTWGYWEISYEDPESAGQYHLHMPGAFWIAGELTPSSVIQDMVTNNITGTYSGGAKGISINTSSEVSELTNGTSLIQVDFGTYQVTGDIAFDEVDLPLTSSSLSTSTSSFSSLITGATSSSVNGAFFGPDAEAIGGNFDAEINGSRYMGIFGGKLPTTP